MLLIAVLSLVCSVLGQHQPYNYGFDTNKLLKRQTLPSKPVVRGVGIAAGGVLPVRREIRELQQDEDQWTLYLLGLSMMQFTNQSDPTSWYGLTGQYPPVFFFTPSPSFGSSDRTQAYMEFRFKPGAA